MQSGQALDLRKTIKSVKSIKGQHRVSKAKICNRLLLCVGQCFTKTGVILLSIESKIFFRKAVRKVTVMKFF